MATDELTHEGQLRFAEWLEILKKTFRVEVSPNNPQVILETKAGVEVIITPAPQLGAMYFTAMIGDANPGDEGLLAGLLKANLFQASAPLGWFALDDQGREVCWQAKWDRYPTATAEEFVEHLTLFMGIAETLRDEFLNRGSTAKAPAASVNDFSMIKV